MKRNVSVLITAMTVLLIACSSKSGSDGRAVSNRIIRAMCADSAVIVSAVAELDTLVAPEIFGRDFAIALVAVAESDTVLSGADLNKRVKILRSAYAGRAGERAYQRFAEGVQSYIDGLPVDRKMRVYTRVASPEQLGTALRIDRYRNLGDSLCVKEQVEALRAIYSAEEYASFMKYFNR